MGSNTQSLIWMSKRMSWSAGLINPWVAEETICKRQRDDASQNSKTFFENFFFLVFSTSTKNWPLLFRSCKLLVFFSQMSYGACCMGLWVFACVCFVAWFFWKCCLVFLKNDSRANISSSCRTTCLRTTTALRNSGSRLWYRFSIISTIAHFQCSGQAPPPGYGFWIFCDRNWFIIFQVRRPVNLPLQDMVLLTFFLTSEWNFANKRSTVWTASSCRWHYSRFLSQSSWLDEQELLVTAVTWTQFDKTSFPLQVNLLLEHLLPMVNPMVSGILVFNNFLSSILPRWCTTSTRVRRRTTWIWFQKFIFICWHSFQDNPQHLVENREKTTIYFLNEHTGGGYQAPVPTQDQLVGFFNAVDRFDFPPWTSLFFRIFVDHSSFWAHVFILWPKFRDRSGRISAMELQSGADGEWGMGNGDGNGAVWLLSQTRSTRPCHLLPF